MTVVVGIKYAEHARNFVEKVRALFGKQESTLDLVHALPEKHEFPSFYKEILGSFDITELDQVQLAADERKATELMKNLKDELGHEKPIQVEMVRGHDTALALMEKARQTQANMIAIEVDEHLYSVIPKGLSVALRLMKSSELPVLILRRSASNRFGRNEHCFVVADDLTASSIPALRQAVQIAANLGNTRLIHMHVIENDWMTLQELGELGRVRTSLRLPELIEVLEKNVSRVLSKRAAEYQHLLSANACTYETVVHVGQVSRNFGSLLDKYNPELVVFGRGPQTPTRLFGIGRLPLAAMLARNEGVLLVPS